VAQVMKHEIFNPARTLQRVQRPRNERPVSYITTKVESSALTEGVGVMQRAQLLRRAGCMPQQ
jgi:hypothetical protein